MEEKYIVALEIGSSKIKGAIGIVDSAGILSVKAVEEEKLTTDSVRYGRICNVLETNTAISKVISRLEQREPQRKVRGVYVAIGGRSLMSQTFDVERRLPVESEILQDHINDLLNEARNQQLHDRKIISVEPIEYRVDNVPTQRVVGMFGSQISARLNIISCRNLIIRPLNAVLEKSPQLAINGYFVRHTAQADIVLHSEDKMKGCMLVDFGADTTTVSIYKNGAMIYLVTIPIGSHHITRDITKLNYLESRAEDLKIQGGNAASTFDSADRSNNVTGGFDYTAVNNYVSARAGEIIANINMQIKYAGLTPEQLPAGIILIGRGAKLSGFDRRLQTSTSLNVRIGTPFDRIHILDGRVNAADHIDVISILSAAAKNCNGVKNCMERIVIEQPTYVSPTQPLGQTTAASTATTAASTATAQPEQPRQAAATVNPGYQPGGYVQEPAGRVQQQSQSRYADDASRIRKVDPADEDVEDDSYEPRKESPIRRTWKGLTRRLSDLLTEPVDDEDDDFDNQK